MKVVIDTNVLVSALLAPPGPPGEVIRLAARGELSPLYDHRIFSEYEDVLSRPKFSFDPKEIQELLGVFTARGTRVGANPMANVCRDPDDMPFYEVAISGEADALITGNVGDFPATKPGALKIIRPSDFLKEFSARPS
jgi:putative PIN family toxin of toxin-antitoxin system